MVQDNRVNSFSARSLTVVFPLKIITIPPPKDVTQETTWVQYTCGAPLDQDGIVFCNIRAPIQSKVVHRQYMHGAYHLKSLSTQHKMNHLIDPFHTHPRCNFATKERNKLARESTQPRGSVLGSSLSLTLPHSYSLPLFSLKVHDAWYQNLQGPSTDCSIIQRKGTKVA